MRVKLIPQSPMRKELLQVIDSEWKACTKCAIGESATNHVLYEIPRKVQGDTLDIVFIGEGPGENEDLEGRPFIGKAGQFLRATIREANPEGVSYGITNLIACRPWLPGNKNRPPSEEEKINCRDRLLDFLEITKPAYVVFLGKVPSNYAAWVMKGCKHTFSPKYWYHPSYLIRNGGKSSIIYHPYLTGFRGLFQEVRSGKAS